MNQPDLTNTTLICMVGFPRSGKSTIAKQLSARYNAPIVEPDAIRLTVHGTAYRQEIEPLIHATTAVMVRSLLNAGHQVVILDEVGNTRRIRDQARVMGAARTLFYPVPTSPEVCKERAVATDQAYLLPVIDKMAAQFQPLEDDESLYRGSVGR